MLQMSLKYLTLCFSCTLFLDLPRYSAANLLSSPMSSWFMLVRSPLSAQPAANVLPTHRICRSTIGSILVLSHTVASCAIADSHSCVTFSSTSEPTRVRSLTVAVMLAAQKPSHSSRICRATHAATWQTSRSAATRATSVSAMSEACRSTSQNTQKQNI